MHMPIKALMALLLLLTVGFLLYLPEDEAEQPQQAKAVHVTPQQTLVVKPSPDTHVPSQADVPETATGKPQPATIPEQAVAKAQLPTSVEAVTGWLSLFPKYDLLCRPGEHLQLTVKRQSFGMDKKGIALKDGVVWKSSAPAVATVDHGTVRCHNAGITTLLVQSDGLSLRRIVRVFDESVQLKLGIIYPRPGDALPVGIASFVFIEFQTADGLTQRVRPDSIQSSDTFVAKALSGVGKRLPSVLGVQEGSARITGYWHGQQASKDLRVVPRDKIHKMRILWRGRIPPNPLNLLLSSDREYLEVSSIPLPIDASQVMWTIEPSDVVRIEQAADSQDHVTANRWQIVPLRVGEATVTLHVANLTQQLKLRILDAESVDYELQLLPVEQQTIRVGDVVPLTLFRQQQGQTIDLREKLDGAVQWRVSDPSVLALMNTDEGVALRALAMGAATVTVNDGRKSASLSLEVTAKPVSISPGRYPISVPVGGSIDAIYDLDFNIHYSDGFNNDMIDFTPRWLAPVHYQSRTPEIFIVEGANIYNYALRAISAGNGKLEIDFAGVKAVVNVDVRSDNRPVELRFMRGHKAFSLGKKDYLFMMLVYADGSQHRPSLEDDISIQSSAPDVLMVDRVRRAYAIATGYATITAHHRPSGLSVSHTYEVRGQSPERLLIDKTHIILPSGAFYFMPNIWAEYADGSREKVNERIYFSSPGLDPLRHPLLGSLNASGRGFFAYGNLAKITPITAHLGATTAQFTVEIRDSVRAEGIDCGLEPYFQMAVNEQRSFFCYLQYRDPLIRRRATGVQAQSSDPFVLSVQREKIIALHAGHATLSMLAEGIQQQVEIDVYTSP
jgi:hypothetical protein